MPIHDYKCRTCKRTNEEFFLAHEKVPETRVCMVCGGTMDKQVGNANIHFRDGFPGNDMKRKK